MCPLRPTLVGLVTTFAVGGLLLGCGGSDDSAASPSSTSVTVETSDGSLTSGSAAVTEPSVETVPPATDAPVDTDPPTTPATTTAATTTTTPDDGACLVGEWVVTEQEMDGFYAGLMSTMDAPLTIDTVGSAPLSFAADGTYAWAPAFDLTVEVAGVSGTGQVAGTITGNWIATDGVVTTASDVNALTVFITVRGQTIDGADLANGFLNSSPVNGVTYSCDGPTPVLDFKTGDPSVTVPVTLTPA